MVDKIGRLSHPKREGFDPIRLVRIGEADWQLSMMRYLLDRGT
jgi:hypothetical protein